MLRIPSLNMPNKNTIPGILDGMCVEGPCIIDKDGIHPVKLKALPTALEAMINEIFELQKDVIAPLKWE